MQFRHRQLLACHPFLRQPIQDGEVPPVHSCLDSFTFSANSHSLASLSALECTEEVPYLFLWKARSWEEAHAGAQWANSLGQGYRHVPLALQSPHSVLSSSLIKRPIVGGPSKVGAGFLFGHFSHIISQFSEK